MFKASNIHYETAERGRGVSCRGIGTIQLTVERLGDGELEETVLQLRKPHLPYHESDHVLNMAYHAMLGGISGSKRSSWVARRRFSERLRGAAADTGSEDQWRVHRTL